LLRKGDWSGIDLLVDVLLQKPGIISDNVRKDAMAAISWGAANGSTVIKVKTLLASSDPDVRRAGACNLMRSGSQKAIEPLLSALNDTDFETRYYAVAGLAQITGQDDWRPTIDQFREDERKYLQHWKDWR
jgi:HEAT repeat protein